MGARETRGTGNGLRKTRAAPACPAAASFHVGFEILQRRVEVRAIQIFPASEPKRGSGVGRETASSVAVILTLVWRKASGRGRLPSGCASRTAVIVFMARPQRGRRGGIKPVPARPAYPGLESTRSHSHCASMSAKQIVQGLLPTFPVNLSLHEVARETEFVNGSATGFGRDGTRQAHPHQGHRTRTAVMGYPVSFLDSLGRSQCRRRKQVEVTYCYSPDFVRQKATVKQPFHFQACGILR